MFLHFYFITFSDKAVQMPTMTTVRHSRPKYHKSAHKILIYGQIKSSTESLKCVNLMEAELIHHLVIQNSNISIPQLMIPALSETIWNMIMYTIIKPCFHNIINSTIITCVTRAFVWYEKQRCVALALMQHSMLPSAVVYASKRQSH